MTEKGKAIADEPEEEEEDLQAMIAQIKAQDDEAENFSQAPSAIELPPYIPRGKGQPRYRRTSRPRRVRSRPRFFRMR